MRIVFLFVAFFLPTLAHASCNGEPGCAPRADLKIASAEAFCYRNDGEELERFKGGDWQICEQMTADGYYACYHDKPKTNPWIEVTCINKQEVGLKIDYWADGGVFIFAPSENPNQKVSREIKIIEKLEKN